MTMAYMSHQPPGLVISEPTSVCPSGRHDRPSRGRPGAACTNPAGPGTPGRASVPCEHARSPTQWAPAPPAHLAGPTRKGHHRDRHSPRYLPRAGAGTGRASAGPPAMSRSSSATTSRPACGRSSRSTPPPSARPSAAPASTPTPASATRSHDVLNLSRGMSYKAALAGLDLGGGKAVIIGDPATRQDRGAAARLRPLRAVAGRPLLHRLRRRHLLRGHGRRSRASAPSSPAAPSRTAAPATPRCSRRTASSRACAPRPRRAWGAPTLHGRTVGVAGVGKVGRHLVAPPASRTAPTSSSPTWTPPRSPRCRPSTPTYASVADTDALVALASSTSTPRARSAARSTDEVVERADAPRSSAAPPTTSSPTTASRSSSQDRGVLYAPDYCVNAGGLIQVADELEGFSFERAKQRADEDLRHHRAGCSRSPTPTGVPAGGRRRPARRAPDDRGRPAAGHLARLRR